MLSTYANNHLVFYGRILLDCDKTQQSRKLRKEKKTAGYNYRNAIISLLYADRNPFEIQ